MLYSLDDLQHPITDVPHAREYHVWRDRLTKQQYDEIVAKLNELVDGDEVHTSSWMPGSNWSGTPFQPIWEFACAKNVDAAAKCFGLILWEVMMARSEDWSFDRFEKNNVPIEGLTYFRIHRRP